MATCRGCDEQHGSLLRGAFVGVLLLDIVRAHSDTNPRKRDDICEKLGVDEAATANEVRDSHARRRAEFVTSGFRHF